MSKAHARRSSLEGQHGERSSNMDQITIDVADALHKIWPTPYSPGGADWRWEERESILTAPVDDDLQTRDTFPLGWNLPATGTEICLIGRSRIVHGSWL